MPTATQAIQVPLVRANIRIDKGTNRPKFVPMYEVPLIEEMWKGRATVEVSVVADDAPHDFRFREVASKSNEIARLKTIYNKKSRNQMIFDHIYAFGRFDDAWLRTLSGEWAPSGGEVATLPTKSDNEVKIHPATIVDEKPATVEDAPTGELPAHADAETDEFRESEELPAAADKPADARVDALTAIKGVGDELAEDLIAAGCDTIEDVAQMPLDELEAIPGIGPSSAKKIQASAVDIGMGE